MLEESNTRVTYLLGAGASANAHPIIRNEKNTNLFSTALKETANKLVEEKDVEQKYIEVVSNIVKDLRWLANKTEEFSTPDTFAKFLYLTNQNELTKLKQALVFYFSYEQLILKKIDKRYLIFLTTILQNRYIFPENIKILNWNYDFQMQLASEKFKEESLHRGNKVTVHSPPTLRYFPQLGYERGEVDSKQTKMMHLNGIAGLFEIDGQNYTQSIFTTEIIKSFNDLLKFFYTPHEKEFYTTFAWEKNNSPALINRYKTKFLNLLLEEIDILVVIGYSFPFFNREIDKIIMQKVKESGTFKEIYFQDPYRDGQFLRSQFDLPDKIEIEHVQNCDQFFIPMEL